MTPNKIALALAIAAVSTAASAQSARDYISIVGSSTVYPFATVVAEQFGRSTDFKTPKIESTGSGGGLKLFCAGVGVEHPDITNASRRIKQSEIDDCAANGVTEVVEVKIGYDGIVLANSTNAERFEITRQELYTALAKTLPNADGELVDNPYTRWSEINGDLPDTKIEVLGPPPTSGTRDAFVELVMEESCDQFEAIKMLAETDKDTHKAVCQGIREDGAYIEAGENDNLIVQKLDANKDALGIFGYSFLEQNADKVQGANIDGVEATFENIASGDYPVSRGLFFYVKKAHVGVIPGIKEYVEEFVSDAAVGEDGYLVDRGLIPLPEDELEAIRSNVAEMKHVSL